MATTSPGGNVGPRIFARSGVEAIPAVHLRRDAGPVLVVAGHLDPIDEECPSVREVTAVAAVERTRGFVARRR